MTDKQEISSTTQKFLDIFDITNDVVILKDGTVSMLLIISAMNFGLLAEQEQDAIIYSYAALLNSLNFPIQIIINSKTKDATAYLQLLETQVQKVSSEAKRGLIKRYQNFVGQLIKERNVLDKKFYVVIPAMPIEVGMLTAQSVLPGNQSPQLSQEQKAAVIEKGLGILEPRRDHLISQFNRIGLYARQLITQEIIEIFYNNYNPEAYEGQQITDSQNYTTAMVNAGVITPLPRTQVSAPALEEQPINQMPEPSTPPEAVLPNQQPMPTSPVAPKKTLPKSANMPIPPASAPKAGQSGFSSMPPVAEL